MFEARVDELAEVLLQTDVDAIAANDSHVVFTVRVSRAFLRENHAFLAAISDFASGADLPKRQPAAVEPTPSAATAMAPAASRSRLRLIAVGACVATAFGVGLCLPQIHLARSGRALAHQMLPSAGATEPR